MVRKDYPDTIPPGLRKCPLKFKKKRKQWADQFCDKDRCGWWNDEKGRCGYIR